MAKRKRRSTPRRRATSSTRTTRRRRRRSGMGAGMFSNPLVGAAAGAAIAGVVIGFLSKPSATTGKPIIENPMLRIGIAGAGGFFAAKFLKAPAVGLGAVAVASYGLLKTTVFKTSPIFGALSEDAEITYVNPALLSESTTLSDGTTLALGDGTYLERQNGEWTGPYTAAGY